MATPSAVQEGSARAEQIHAEVYGNPAEGDEQAAEQQAAQETQPVATEEKTKVDPEDYKERFSRYKATTDNTIHGLRTDLSAERDRNQELEERIATLEGVLASAPAPKGPGVELTEDELDLLDEETAAVVAKIVDARMKPLQERQKATDSELARDRQIRVANQEKQRQDDFKARLSEQVPDAATVDADPAFRKWLSEPDPASGRVRLELARAAKSNDDVERVASFYRTWLAEQGRADPREELISPSRAADAGQTGPTGKVWTRAEIKGFYQAKREGQMSSDEAQRIEQDIFAAQREGRIR